MECGSWATKQSGSKQAIAQEQQTSTQQRSKRRRLYDQVSPIRPRRYLMRAAKVRTPSRPRRRPPPRPRSAGGICSQLNEPEHDHTALPQRCGTRAKLHWGPR